MPEATKHGAVTKLPVGGGSNNFTRRSNALLMVIFGNDDAHPPSVVCPSEAEGSASEVYQIKDEHRAAFGSLDAGPLPCCTLYALRDQHTLLVPKENSLASEDAI
jgi:hypothetical protein